MSSIDEEKWIKRVNRERAARKEAERLLEEKSLELWEINQKLEIKVEQRTRDLRHALGVLENSIKSKDMFLAKMSHELRTPLNAIIGFSQILMLKSDVNENTKKYIEKIYISGNNLLELVNTILDFAKLEANETEFNPKNICLKELLREVKILIEPIALKKEIELEFPLSEDIEIYADKDLIKRVLLNLLSNAIKFTPKYGNITVFIERRVDIAYFEIKDSGVGIKKEHQESIFSPFSQVTDSYSEVTQGTGLGLAIVKDIVDLHNGTIGLESEYEKGSKFYFTLPLNSCDLT
jgi:signal transduction histidine kinase